MLKLISIFALSLALAACNEVKSGPVANDISPYELKEDFRITRAKEHILLVAKDPKSVQFKDLHVTKNYSFVCGQLNAKNSFGGYTGYLNFFFELSKDKLLIVDPTNRDAVIKYTYNCFIT